MSNIEPITSIDLGVRNVLTGYIDCIRAVAETILEPRYAATGDALSWAENIEDSISDAWDDNGHMSTLEYASDELDAILTDGIEHLYQSTGLYAAEDGYMGMFNIAPIEFFDEED